MGQSRVTTDVAAPTAIYSGKTTVAAAGTRVALASAQAVLGVTIKALSTNSGKIYVGGAAVAAANGFQLAAGETASLDISDLSTIEIDSDINGEGVTYLAVG